MGAPQMKEALKFQIEITQGPHQGTKKTFSKEIVSIGRGPENDIVLSNDPKVSRQHAEIRQRDADFVIVNLSQKNFILFNGQNVQTEILTQGSVIQIGDSEIRFMQEQQRVEKNVLQPLKFQPPPPRAAAPAMAPPRPPQQNSGPINPGMRIVKPGPPASDGGLLSNPRARFYGVIAVLGLVGFFFFAGGNKNKKKDPNSFRTSTISMQDVASAEKRSQELLTVKKEKYDSIQYRRAQENFIKGFRDYQQGQYARAREAFQVVLNLDPGNELAQRYFHLSKIKFDELVKFNMIQGNRYREKRNWRMCQSNYSNVMTMLQYRKDDPSFREAKQYFEECSLNLEGRF